MVPRRDPPGKGSISFDDVVVVVCFLALIGIVIIGGVLMLLFSITATLPVSPRISCPELDGCVVPEPDESPVVSVDDYWTDGPMLTR
jgi:hypothetical protein